MKSTLERIVGWLRDVYTPKVAMIDLHEWGRTSRGLGRVSETFRDRAIALIRDFNATRPGEAFAAAERGEIGAVQ